MNLVVQFLPEGAFDAICMHLLEDSCDEVVEASIEGYRHQLAMILNLTDDTLL